MPPDIQPCQEAVETPAGALVFYVQHRLLEHGGQYAATAYHPDTGVMVMSICADLYGDSSRRQACADAAEIAFFTVGQIRAYQALESINE